MRRLREAWHYVKFSWFLWHELGTLNWFLIALAELPLLVCPWSLINLKLWNLVDWILTAMFVDEDFANCYIALRKRAPRRRVEDLYFRKLKRRRERVGCETRL